MNELLVWSLGKAREQTLNLVSDLRDEQMCQQSSPGENHPAWTLGHLFMGDCLLLMLLQTANAPQMPAGWLELYGPGQPTSGDPSQYRKKEEYISMLIESDKYRQMAIQALAAADLARPTPDPRFAKVQPTVGHLLHYLLFHEGNHGGQLAAWRKRQGLASGSGAFGII